jgi:hypothetical protein
MLKNEQRVPHSPRRASRQRDVHDGLLTTWRSGALELAGVEFIDENGVGPGVRLRKRQRPKQPK